MIAFDDRRLIYEGDSFYGYGLWPAPVITPATLVAGDDSYRSIPESDFLISAKLVFREDSFDPVTRVRRGRFYVNHGGQPVQWHVHPHFFLPSQALTPMNLVTFQRWQASKELGPDTKRAIVALGIADAYSLWRVIDIERISSGDDLVTLRARSSLGLLPDMKEAAIPEADRGHVLEVLDKVSEAAYRAGPESVIDRCRDACQVCVGVWLASRLDANDVKTLDLSPLLDKLERELKKDAPTILLHAGRIIARLHARKPNEQVKRGTRSNTEGDAESALSNLGLVLRDLRWTVE